MGFSTNQESVRVFRPLCLYLRPRLRNDTHNKLSHLLSIVVL